MATLLEKVSTLAQANLHRLVDQALEANSLAVVDQYIREMDDHRELLLDAVAVSSGRVKRLEEKVRQLESRQAELDRRVDRLLVGGDEEAATEAQARLNSHARLLQEVQGQLESQRAQHEELKAAHQRMEEVLAAARREREELASLLEVVRGKELVAEAGATLEGLAGAGDPDVARIADSIRDRLAKAEARLALEAEPPVPPFEEPALSKVEGTTEQARIQAQLTERKARLRLQ